jgi:CheY-like chemotaxis protein
MMATPYCVRPVNEKHYAYGKPFLPAISSSRCRGNLPARPGGCLFKAGHEAMNKPNEERPARGKRGEALIYLVDDEPMLLELASAILEPQGYSVETFRSPETALRAFELAEPGPALVVTDYAMHSMNGLELASACRRIRPKQKVLLVSGSAGPDILRDAPVKPDRFLAKPYQAKHLVEAVEAMLAVQLE